jgi:RimJ/RimL family protein N-acetyltransferase
MANPNFHITTPRLYLSHADASNDAHCDMTVDLYHSPTSMKYNPSGPSVVPNREAARSFIESSTERLRRTGYGRYLVSIRPDNEKKDEVESSPFSTNGQELIGTISMQLNRHPAFPGPLIPDLGFNFLPQYHGKGYANEAATHLMQYYREERGTKAFAGLTDDGNVEAKKLLTKLGFKYQGIRCIQGVLNGGREEMLSVWTIGVESETSLEALGL